MHSDEINGVVAEWIGKQTRDEVTRRFNDQEVAFSTIYDISDIFADPQYMERETLARVADDELGQAVVPNVVPKFSETPGSIDFLGPQMGAHNDAVYRTELGYAEDKIRELRDAKII
jgi:formyl-CoA transferase